MGKGFQGPCLSGFLTPKSLRLGLKEGHGGWLGEQRALGEQAAVSTDVQSEPRGREKLVQGWDQLCLTIMSPGPLKNMRILFYHPFFNILAFMYYYRDGALMWHTCRGQKQHSGVSSLLTPLCEL